MHDEDHDSEIASYLDYLQQMLPHTFHPVLHLTYLSKKKGDPKSLKMKKSGSHLHYVC